MPMKVEEVTVSVEPRIITNDRSSKMNKLCKQVSIESPGPILKDCVFSFDVPVPDVPPLGARIKVVCAGACYRLQRNPSVGSITSMSSMSIGSIGGDITCATTTSSAYHGVRDTSLFPGYEVAGVVDALGDDVLENDELLVGDKVVVYPFEGVPSGYPEYMTVPELQFLVKIPDSMNLDIAAMLPTGALCAMNTVLVVQQQVQKVLQQRDPNDKCRLLVVGTGGLALWALRISHYYFSELKDKVSITVASLRDEGFLVAKEDRINVVQWNEDCYEKVLIERTKDACGGEVDIVIDFGTSSRSLHRSLQCLCKGGLVFISSEVAERLMPKFSRLTEDRQQHIKAVEMGTLEQLQELVGLVADGLIEPPPHTVFPAEDAEEVVKKLCRAEIHGRAILRFHSQE